MLSLIGLELSKLKKMLLYSFGLSILFSLAMFFAFLYGYNYQYNIEIWSEAYTFILFLFPIFCTIPTAWLLYYEKKNNFIIYSIIRTKRIKYFASKLIAHCLYGFIVTFVMSIIGLLLALYAAGPVSGTPNPISAFELELYIGQPLMYGLLLTLWRSLLSLLFVALGFFASLLFNNIFVILIFPFVYYILENVLLSVLGFMKFRLITALGLASGGVTSGIEYWHLLIGPAILIAVTAVLFFAVLRKRALNK